MNAPFDPRIKPGTPRDEQVKHLAGLFIGVLGRWLTLEDFTEFCRLTREDYDELTCHSHDFCDANMAMDEAFNMAFGRSTEADSDEDMNLFNDAWTYGKRFIAGRLP